MIFNEVYVRHILESLCKDLKTDQIYLSGECVYEISIGEEPIEIIVLINTPASNEKIERAVRKLMGIREPSSFLVSSNGKQLLMNANEKWIRIIRFDSDFALASAHENLVFPLNAHIKASKIGFVYSTSAYENKVKSNKVKEANVSIKGSELYSPIDLYLRLLRISFEVNKSQYKISFLNNCHQKDFDRFLLAPALAKCAMSSKVHEMFSALSEDESVLHQIAPEFHQMLRIPQRKKRTNTNLLNHSVDTLSCASANLVVRWAGFLHDIGKIYTISYDSKLKKFTFRNHEHVGSYMSERILIRLGYSEAFAKKVSKLIDLHMFPAQFQRNPNWTDRAIRKLMNAAEGDEILLVELAIADKMASQDSFKMVEQLHELRNKMSKMKSTVVDSSDVRLSNNPILLGDRDLEETRDGLY